MAWICPPAGTGSSAAALGALLGAFAFAASAQDAPSGTWIGRYRCAQGWTALMLAIEPTADGVRALFRFAATAENPGVPTGCFEMAGSFDLATGTLRLQAGRWRLRPPGFVTVDLEGRVAGDRLAGSVAGPGCGDFALRRVGEPELPPDCARAPLIAAG